METRHEIEPPGRSIRRYSVVGSVIAGIAVASAWYGGGPGWLLIGTVAVLWWLTYHVVRTPDTIVLLADGVLELHGLGPSRRISVGDLRWIRRLDRSLVLVRYRGGFALITRWYSAFDDLIGEIKRRNRDVRVSI